MRRLKTPQSSCLVLEPFRHLVNMPRLMFNLRYQLLPINKLLVVHLDIHCYFWGCHSSYVLIIFALWLYIVSVEWEYCWSYELCRMNFHIIWGEPTRFPGFVTRSLPPSTFFFLCDGDQVTFFKWQLKAIENTTEHTQNADTQTHKEFNLVLREK